MEKCPECSGPLDPLLGDEHGGRYFRCRRSGFHWVCSAGSWYRAPEWKRFIASQHRFHGRRRSAELSRSPLRRPDWKRRGH